MIVDPHTRVRIAAEAIVSPRTVDRAYREGVSPYMHARITQAAERLGVPLPPERTEQAA